MDRKKGPPSRQHAATTKGKLQRFADFMVRHYPEVDDLVAVRTRHVREFLDQEEARGVSARTWNIMLGLLKTVFREHAEESEAYRGFLKGKKGKPEGTVHRKPFSDEEIQAILDVVKEDDLMRPLIVTAIHTAMRRSDIALLRWDSVDMEGGYITVRTSKTGGTAEIPILPMLREELERIDGARTGFVFPQIAATFQSNPGELNRRLNAILRRVGFADCAGGENLKTSNQKPRKQLQSIPDEQLRVEAMAAITAAPFGPGKKERMRAILEAYLDGETIQGIAGMLGVSPSTPSLHLNQLEDMTGAEVIRRRATSREVDAPQAVVGVIRAERDGTARLKRGNVRGWHSFRTTFITRAIAGGVPEELVRQVTGHATVDVVRKYYLKPDRTDFQRAFEKAMPALTGKGSDSPEDRLREVIASMTPKTCLRDKKRMLAMLDGETFRARAWGRPWPLGGGILEEAAPRRGPGVR